MKRSTILLWLLHLIGNAFLLWLGYYWLGVSESDGVHLLGSALIMLGGVCVALWIHGTALVYFDRDTGYSLSRAMERAGRSIVPLLVLAVCAAVVYGLLAYIYNRFEHNAFLIGSYATMHTHKPVAPEKVLHWYHILIWILRWLVVPALLFPLTAAVARSGWTGFRLHSFRRSRNPLYWIEVCLLLLLAIAVPLRLINWIPEFSKFAMQMVSFMGRMGLGYLLFVAALLTLEFLTSGGKPRFSQPNTAPSP
jgi:hypothetical protein